MESKSNRTHVQQSSHSLIEFLLGDGIHPGWLDNQNHHPFATTALKCPGYPAHAERQAAKSTGRGVWQSATESESGSTFVCPQSNKAAGVVRFTSGSRSTLTF
jgi:hypothetical protein